MFARLFLLLRLGASVVALRLQQPAVVGSAAAALLHSSLGNATATAARAALNRSAVSGRIGTDLNAAAPCKCTASSPKWPKPTRTKPECLFVDLGASDGESYKVFMGESKNFKFNFNTGNFKKSDCYAYLMEPNSQFMKKLESMRSWKAFPMTNMAAYMCDKADADFYVDIYGPNAWGSSLNATHESVRNTKEIKTQVQLYNIARLLVENTIPGDTVVVKMDVEGAERDILPCLANSPAAGLVDFLYLEDHCPGDQWCPTKGMAGNSRETFNAAKAKLVKAGVNIMDYWSPM